MVISTLQIKTDYDLRKWLDCPRSKEAEPKAKEIEEALRVMETKLATQDMDLHSRP